MPRMCRCGILCGATYVNTFHMVSHQTDKDFSEFAMGIVSTATTSGPILAGLIGLLLEPALRGVAVPV